MQLICGLGNPKEEYTLTRHNLGRRTLEALLGADRWEAKPRLSAQVQEKGSGKLKIVFAKSTLFMNESGKSVKALLTFYKMKPRELLVVHDDADILFGKMKLSFGSRPAGHHGVESVAEALNTFEFWRLRIGIQPELSKGRIRAEALILKRFSGEEEKTLPRILNQAHQAIAAWLEKSSF